jgi:hypothetical protein
MFDTFRPVFFMIACSALALMAGTPTYAQQCAAKSPAHALALLELYTSEGCDSCPPADTWLRSLTTARAPESVVPLALHVDYWDYIGWKDPYAKPQFAARQHEIAAITGKSFVYTPQVVFNGRDYRRWGNREFFDDVKKTNALRARAAIELSMTTGPDGRIEARAMANVPAAQDRGDAALHLFVYQSGLLTSVAKGENRGKTLQHDFVARTWSGSSPVDQNGNALSTMNATIPAATGRNAGIAAFVQNRRSAEVLQAFYLPVCSR